MKHEKDKNFFHQEDEFNLDKFKQLELERIQAKQKLKQLENNRNRITAFRNFRKKLYQKISPIPVRIRKASVATRKFLFQWQSINYVSFLISLYYFNKELQALNYQLQQQNYQIIRLESKVDEKKRTIFQQSFEETIQNNWQPILLVFFTTSRLIWQAYTRHRQYIRMQDSIQKVGQSVNRVGAENQQAIESATQRFLFQQQQGFQEISSLQQTLIQKHQENIQVLNSLIEEARQRGESELTIQNYQQDLENAQQYQAQLIERNEEILKQKEEVETLYKEQRFKSSKQKQENIKFKNDLQRSEAVVQKLKRLIQDDKKSIENLNSKLESARNHQNHQSMQIGDLERHVIEKEKQVRGLESKAENFKKDIHEKEQLFKSEKAEQERLHKKYIKSCDEILKTRDQLIRVKSKLQNLKGKDNSLARRLTKSLDDMRNKIEFLEAQEKKLSRELDKKNQKIEKTARQEKKARLKNQKFQNKFKDKQDRLNELQDQYDQTQANMHQQILKTGFMRNELQETKNRLAQKESQLEKFQLANKKANLELEENREALSNAESSLEEMEKAYKEQFKEQQQQIDQRDAAITKLQNQWWRSLKFKVGLQLKEKNKEDEQTKEFYVNPFWGAFGGGVIESADANTLTKPWGSVKVSEKGQQEFKKDVVKLKSQNSNR